MGTGYSHGHEPRVGGARGGHGGGDVESPRPPDSPILALAEKLINEDRQAQYGDARVTHERVAAMWNAIVPQGARIRPIDAVLMMIAVKLVRASKNPFHDDNWVDIVGYAQIGARMSKGDV